MWQRLPGRYSPVLDWSRLDYLVVFNANEERKSEYKVTVSEMFILLMLDRILLRKAKPQGSRAFTVSNGYRSKNLSFRHSDYF